jgi:methylated-DNA-[protein]-cysteine S-methyltransferase
MALLRFATPLGEMALEAEGEYLTRLYLPGAPAPDAADEETPLLLVGRGELLEYLAGRRRAFDLPLLPRGTPFQRRVWAALGDIPYGQTRSYQEIARAVDCPQGARAVGAANHRNPLPILIPCHRVVGRSGALTGYAGGLPLKEALLAVERRGEEGPAPAQKSRFFPCAPEIL